MALSSVGTYGSFASSSSSGGYCATCNSKTANVKLGQTYSNYSGRASNGDSYVCATCGRNPATANRSSTGGTATYGRAGTSGYCPACNQSHGNTSSHWTGGNASSSFSAAKQGVVSGVSWAR